MAFSPSWRGKGCKPPESYLERFFQGVVHRKSDGLIATLLQNGGQPALIATLNTVLRNQMVDTMKKISVPRVGAHLILDKLHFDRLHGPIYTHQ